MENRIVKLDTKDRRILYELEENCRRSLNEIAKKAGLSKQALHYRIVRLVREGAILQFITLIDYARLGYTNYEVWFQFSEIPVEKRAAFLDYLEKHPNTRWLTTCGGKFDGTAAIMAQDITAFSEIWKSITGAYPGIIQNQFITISKKVWTYPRTYMVDKAAERSFRLYSGAPQKRQLDSIERKVLAILSKDARIATIELARKAGTTPTTARTKIRQMEKEGIIQGYRAILQPSRIGIQNYEVLISSQNLSESKEKELEEYCLTNPHITFLLQIIGRWDLDIAFDAESTEHFQQILTEIRTRFGSVIREYEYAPILYVHKFDYAPPLIP